MFERFQRTRRDALTARVHRERQPAVGEVIGCGDAVVEKIQSAVKGAPVNVLGVGMPGVAGHRIDPAVQRLIHAEPARTAGEEMAVRGEKPGSHEGAAGVDEPRAAETDRRFADFDRRSDARRRPPRASPQTDPVGRPTSVISMALRTTSEASVIDNPPREGASPMPNLQAHASTRAKVFPARAADKRQTD